MNKNHRLNLGMKKARLMDKKGDLFRLKTHEVALSHLDTGRFDFVRENERFVVEVLR